MALDKLDLPRNLGYEVLQKPFDSQTQLSRTWHNDMATVDPSPATSVPGEAAAPMTEHDTTTISNATSAQQTEAPKGSSQQQQPARSKPLARKEERSSAGYARQTMVLTSRAFKVTYRDPMGMLAAISEAILMSLIVGYMFYVGMIRATEPGGEAPEEEDDLNAFNAGSATDFLGI